MEKQAKTEQTSDYLQVNYRFIICRDDWTTFELVYKRLARFECTFGDDWERISNKW